MASGLENHTWWCCNGTDLATTVDSPASFGRDKHEINTFYFYETEQFTLLWTLFALIVLGNSAVLAALLYTNKGRKSRMNFFIMQLALADLSVGLISVLTDIIWRITVAWNAGNAACKFIRFLQAMVTYSSTYVLVALSIDRYDAITRPMRFSGSWHRARVLVALAWFFSVLFSLPIVLLYHETPVQGRLQCWIDFPEAWQWQLYMTLVAFTLFVIPALIITACYTVIVITIWRQGRQMQGPPPSGSTKNGKRIESAQGQTVEGQERGGGGAQQPKGQFQGHHPPRQDKDRQDDVRHSFSFHRLLESVHRVRPAAGVWARAADADQPGGGHVHPVAGAAQLGGQPFYLLPLLQQRRQNAAISQGKCATGRQGACEGNGDGRRSGCKTLSV